MKFQIIIKFFYQSLSASIFIQPPFPSPRREERGGEERGGEEKRGEGRRREEKRREERRGEERRELRELFVSV